MAPVFNQGGLASSSSMALCMPPVYNQGPLGACVGNGVAAAVQFDNAKQSEEAFTPSRLFIYYGAREIIGTVNYDSGACIRDGIKFIADVGVCKESTWPYEIADFRKKPDTKSYLEAKECKSLIYHPIDQTASQIEQHLAAGWLIVFGFSVYSSFETTKVKKTGDVPMPDLKNERVEGGHCATLIGYKDKRYKTKQALWRNSYGSEDWGDKGYGTIPYNYILDPDLASDFWVIEQTT